MADGYRGEYLARIHCAQDYIETHLGEELKLEDIARAAHFSSFHFHRLYTALTGETLYQFILRIRLERAATRLCQSMLESVTNIALVQDISPSAIACSCFQGALRRFGQRISNRHGKQDSQYAWHECQSGGYGIAPS